jgi:hypothetical protein
MITSTQPEKKEKEKEETLLCIKTYAIHKNPEIPFD